MVRILLNKQDLMNISSWAGLVVNERGNVGVPFETDEYETLIKIKKASGSFERVKELEKEMREIDND